ncbi:MAG: hypothetical protein LBL75_02745 [Rickettsiales bacterium]|jgi:hypothetical protein|nr:hypothetical protein [Rickettsiales bacterium]
MEVPEKFQNNDGTLNSDALIKSYSELEKKLGTMISVPGADADNDTREKFMRALGVPENANDYPKNDLFDDETIREKFRDAGLTPTQVEKIYSIANEFLSPALSEIFTKQSETDAMNELKSFFGGNDKMITALKEIDAYAEKFLPADAYETLTASPAGIKSIYKMMQSAEPEIEVGNLRSEKLSDSDLRAMMRDPKYWRDHDTEYVRKVENGFKKLYA